VRCNLEDYEIKIKNEESSDIFYYKSVEVKLKNGLSISDCKILKSNVLKGVAKIPLGEVFLRVNANELIKTVSDSDIKDKFKNKLNAKISASRECYALFIEIFMDNFDIQSTNLEKLATAINEIYYSHEKVCLAATPKLSFSKDFKDLDIRNIFLKHYLTFLDYLLSQTKVKPVLFLPDYLPPDINAGELLKWHSNKYDGGGLYAVDFGGVRFSSDGYKKVAAFERMIKQFEIGNKNYAFYLFDFKPYKKSSEVSPSEELLAILNGSSFIGLNHTRIKISSEILEKINKQGHVAKVFNRESFLYENKKLESNKSQEEIYDIATNNDIEINKILLNEFSKGNIEKELSAKKRELFVQTLKKIRKKYKQLKEQGILSAVLSV